MAYWSLNPGGLLNVDTFHYIRQKKITFVHITTHWKNLLTPGSCQATSARHELSKMLIFSEKRKFCHWQSILPFIFLT